MQPKYLINDIIQHKKSPDLKRKIIFMFNEFHDETGKSKEIYYQTINLENNKYSPCPLKESAINIYYLKI